MESDLSTMCEIFGVKRKTSISPQLFASLLSVIGAARRERILRFRKREDAERALIADVLIRAIICRKLHLTNQHIVFDSNRHGKPFLQHHSDFHFNLSHAGEWVVCAVGSKPVGIDVEYIRPVSLTLAKRFFSDEEYRAIMEKEVSSRLPFFFELWTLKESYIKALGRGLSLSLASFTISTGETGIGCTTGLNAGKWFFKQYDAGPGYKCAVCSASDEIADHIVVEDVEKLADLLF
jgi:4'-phosphopantetheinyl transferase